MRDTQMKAYRIRFVLLCAIVLCALASFGQVQTGLPRLGSFQQVGPLTINLANLNAHLSIPIISKAGRGSLFTYALTYDNSFWQVGSSAPPYQSWWHTNDAICAPPCTSSSSYGWQSQGNAVTGYIEYQV